MKNREHMILVVEDEVPLQKAIQKKLEINGFDTVTARTVDQAMAYLKKPRKIDAIWLDHYLLGKENGLDFVAKLKDDGVEWKNIPVFVVSNTASADKVKSYIKLGINNYYTKSDYPLESIITDIKSLLREGE